MLKLTPATACLLVGNLLDAVLTMMLLEMGMAHEANPLLERAYAVSPVAFVVAKLVMVQLSVLVAASCGREWAFAAVVRMGAVMYTSVVTYQVLLMATLA